MGYLFSGCDRCRLLLDVVDICGREMGMMSEEEAALVAVERLYTRRMAEIRTTEEMQRKTAMTAGTGHGGENK